MSMTSLLLEIAGMIFLLLLALWAGYELVALRRKRKHQREIWNNTMNLPLELRDIGLRHINRERNDGRLQGEQVRSGAANGTDQKRESRRDRQ
jgi:hypothetical protein